MSEDLDGGIDRENKPGVCGYCGYRIDPDTEEVAVNDGWDFDHQKCAEESS